MVDFTNSVKLSLVSFNQVSYLVRNFEFRIETRITD
jgi:hypothetical protein